MTAKVEQTNSIENSPVKSVIFIRYLGFVISKKNHPLHSTTQSIGKRHAIITVWIFKIIDGSLFAFVFGQQFPNFTIRGI